MTIECILMIIIHCDNKLIFDGFDFKLFLDDDSMSMLVFDFEVIILIN